MNREDARKYAEIMMAYANGADVEIYDGGEWTSIIDPLFDFLNCIYRIKPKLKKRYMTRNEVLHFVTNTRGIVVTTDDCTYFYPATATDYSDYDDGVTEYFWAYANFDAEGEPVDGWHKFEVEE